MSIEQIGDHMAFACSCGCVRFNLLKSGSIECDECGEKPANSHWQQTCNHDREKVTAGESYPLRWGSVETEVCECGAWRSMQLRDESWRTKPLADCISENENW